MSTAFRNRVIEGKARVLCRNAAQAPGAEAEPRAHYGVCAMRQGRPVTTGSPKRDAQAEILASLMPDLRPHPKHLEASQPDSGRGHSPPFLPRTPMPP